jgi:hypothetical protein
MSGSSPFDDLEVEDMTPHVQVVPLLPHCLQLGGWKVGILFHIRPLPCFVFFSRLMPVSRDLRPQFSGKLHVEFRGTRYFGWSRACVLSEPEFEGKWAISEGFWLAWEASPIFSCGPSILCVYYCSCQYFIAWNVD